MATTTTAELIVKPPQYVEETTEGSKVTASPSYTMCGVPKSISFKINGQHIEVSQLGDEDLITLAQGPQTYESTIVFSMLNSTFLKYLVNDANFGTPTGTASKTLNIVFSYYLNGTENYVFLLGSRVKDGSIKMEIGKETECTINFVHTSITTPSSTSGLTTPTHPSIPSGAVWDWTSGGANPVSWNSSAQDCRAITININRNTKEDHTLGNLDPHSSQLHARRISGDMTILNTATTLLADMKASTARTLAVVLKSSTSTLTLSNVKLDAFDSGFDSGSNETVVDTFPFKALTCTVS